MRFQFALHGCFCLVALVFANSGNHALSSRAFVVDSDARIEPTVKVEPRTVTAKSLYSAMQKLGAKYRKDKSDVENRLRFSKLQEEIVKDFGNASISYRVKIRTVRWKDGIASLETAWPLPNSKPTNASPLKFTNPIPLELMMEEKEAATIKPGDWVTFTGSLTLHPGRWGAVGVTTKSQQLFTVTHHDLVPAQFIGTFTSVDYTGEVKGKLYPGRWQAAPAEK